MCLVQRIGAHGGEFMYFGCFCVRGELGFLDCDDICTCFVSVFELQWYMWGVDQGFGVLLCLCEL